MVTTQMLEKILLKLQNIKNDYELLIFKPIKELNVKYTETREKLNSPPTNVQYKDATHGMNWGGEGVYAWYNCAVEITKELSEKKLFISADTGAYESFIFANGIPKGLHANKITYNTHGNHNTLYICENAKIGDTITFDIESYAGHYCIGNMPFEKIERNGNICTYDGIRIFERRDDIMRFVFDLDALLELANNVPKDGFKRAALLNNLHEVFNVIEQFPDDCVNEDKMRAKLAKAIKIMSEQLLLKNSETVAEVGLIGHSHMDTAWLWTIGETVKKCARTFSNAINLMEQYPEFKFIQSSAYHLEMMRRNYPKLFDMIKEKVKLGSYEPNGGVWVECDCNISSGESMIRQFLWGQKYTSKYFNYRSDSFWLPDTFGYNAAIPQIMKGCGIQYFLTTKLSWNAENRFPFDTFTWRGNDGTDVLVHFNTTHTFAGPKAIIEATTTSENNDILHKHVNNKRLMAYGFGDGGGGPQYEMAEQARRVTDLEGCPKAKYTTVSDFMKDLEASSKNIPLYMGELYLELHRGTLTNQHKIKRNNRKAEILLHNVDFLNSLLHMNGIETLSKSELNGMYETLLVNQFHDILPGTCIPEAHDQCHKEIDALIKEATSTIDKMMSKLVAKSDDITALNAISVDMTNQFVIPNDVYLSGGKHQDIIDINGKCERYVGGVSVPALSISTLETTVEYAKKDSSFAYAEDILTTPFFKVKFDEFGYIESLVNVSNGREVRGTGNPLNAFVTAKDVPYLWDNWDLDADAFCQFELETRLISREIVADGELQFRIRSTYDIAENSKIIQDMIFYSDNNRIDFDTIVDWKDKHKFLKVGFDININASFARHEIQFGYMERPTYKKNPYEESMFEVCNHKYTDISETRFGVSVLNDCKYGISVDGSNMMLSLHKGGCRPDPRGDFGVHRMKYSLLVHDDAFGTETVVDEAYRFNNPVKVFKGSVVVDTTACVNIEASNIMVETVKMAEENEMVILRLYECEKTATRTRIEFAPWVDKVWITDMLEEKDIELPLIDNIAEVDFRTFEIKTLKIQGS